MSSPAPVAGTPVAPVETTAPTYTYGAPMLTSYSAMPAYSYPAYSYPTATEGTTYAAPQYTYAAPTYTYPTPTAEPEKVEYSTPVPAPATYAYPQQYPQQYAYPQYYAPPPVAPVTKTAPKKKCCGC
uniref:Uncharacterized protein n=1 Tax=Chromera velia CCMP2878 TaxID=1169474 RepID=A0A0G4HKL7_9ALVE|mmetsp:Transcript_54064/g.105780  ORF Transcript_54064/g.105780 Transcript_54064/m.105780 type:complete len:127 (+) Transcript_54064:103-483(+)|eukprot:Cvel_28538.t1-p1 / transcript=Cvel_28538.t1 / gene=Cvel_28538 / organism=Chromera_velia_CCMP2878 / gene_product=hypothetical protein / transcript_product=hypothetical protein / location=Cvel_scaffold3757:8608-9332(-) / protein_length=126 / sequence_SO=supercontig / SO=protein_coding / is_pseudo=false